MHNKVHIPKRKEFDELEENDRKRAGITSGLTTSQGQRYNGGNDKMINVNKSVLPYDQNRVKLQTLINGMDYINASWIQKVKEDSAYDDLYDFMPSSGMNIILTQDPTSDTMPHYLQMILEQRIDIIVHIGSERNVPKWRKNRFGDLSTELIERVDFVNFVIREKVDIFLKRKKSVVNHEATILHFTAWPKNDSFGEDESRKLLRFISLVRQEIGKPIKNFTLASHDATGGVGGAATFIAMYQMIQDLDSKIKERIPGNPIIGSLNVFDKVNELRKERAHMIQTFANYKFLFSILAYYASDKSNSDMAVDWKKDDGEDDIVETYHDEDDQVYVYDENDETSRPLSDIYVN